MIPPVNESHVEMDLAWAIFEAWIKIQTGEVDTALVYAFGKSSAGVLRRTLALQLEPYTMTPLWPDTGTVTTFSIVNVPFLGQRITPPYVSAYILLDGADIAFLHMILDIPAEEVRMGMRVKAVWKPRDEWGTTIENISHFSPTGEPDADYDTYQQHL